MEVNTPIVWLNPARAPEKERLESLVEWMLAGGRALIMLRSDHAHIPRLKPLLDL